MILSEHEIEIITKVLKYRTYNFQTYVYDFYNGKEITNKYCEIFKYDPEKVRAIVLRNTTDIYRKCSTFFILMQKLENNQLIYKFNYQSNEYWNYFSELDDKNTEDSYERLDILDRFISNKDFSQYMPSSEFFNFVDNGYKTIDEIEKENEKLFREDQLKIDRITREEEKKDRVQAQRLTIAISVLSILLSGLFNFLTYKTKREVEIINSKQNPIQLFIADTSKNVVPKTDIKTADNTSKSKVLK